MDTFCDWFWPVGVVLKIKEGPLFSRKRKRNHSKTQNNTGPCRKSFDPYRICPVGGAVFVLERDEIILIVSHGRGKNNPSLFDTPTRRNRRLVSKQTTIEENASQKGILKRGTNQIEWIIAFATYLRHMNETETLVLCISRAWPMRCIPMAK